MAPKDSFEITPELLLQAYAAGIFPMSDGGAEDEIFWVDPKARGILPLDRFHISRSLTRAIRRQDYQVRVNTTFEDVVNACADRPETWINAVILSLYNRLHQLGFAHSVEVFDTDDQLVGGVYGVALGGAFFGESMFSRRKDGSKIALAYLVDRLRAGGFVLFDTQFVTDHLLTMGATEISRDAYQEMLAEALDINAEFLAQPSVAASASGILQRNTQTS